MWTGSIAQERLGLLSPAQEHVLVQEDGKERCLKAIRELSQAFAALWAIPTAAAAFMASFMGILLYPGGPRGAEVVIECLGLKERVRRGAGISEGKLARGWLNQRDSFILHE